jgi:hypothetical protein
MDEKYRFAATVAGIFLYSGIAGVFFAVERPGPMNFSPMRY